MKEVAKPLGKVLPGIFLMSFECSLVLSPLLERFDYRIRKSGIIRNGSANEAGEV